MAQHVHGPIFNFVSHFFKVFQKNLKPQFFHKKMGCATSKNENKSNKDVCERRKILVGLHMSKNPDGIKTNFQLAIERKAKKPTKYPAVKEEKDNCS